MKDIRVEASNLDPEEGLDLSRYLDRVIAELVAASAADDTFDAHVQAEQARAERAESSAEDHAQSVRTNAAQSFANLSQRIEWRRRDLERSDIYLQSQPEPPARAHRSSEQSAYTQYAASEQRYLEAEQALITTLRDYDRQQAHRRRRAQWRNALIAVCVTLIAIVTIIATSQDDANDLNAPSQVTLQVSASPQIAAIESSGQNDHSPTASPIPSTTAVSAVVTSASLSNVAALIPTLSAPTAIIVSATPSKAPVSTETVVPSSTPLPSSTPRPSNTMRPSSTPRPTRTPRPTATERITCPGLVTPRLVIGERAQITPGDANNVRSRPGTGNPRIGTIPGGEEVLVLNGPACADGYVWWLVDFEGLVGWTAEGGSTYFIVPLGRQSSSSVSRRQTTAAYQMFDNGYMIWLAYNDQIYVLLEGGRYHVFPDTLNESLRNEMIGIPPPPLRYEPRSGFGIVWREEDSIRADIGWALHQETGYTATVTYDSRSDSMTITGPEQQFFELDGDGTWTGG